MIIIKISPKTIALFFSILIIFVLGFYVFAQVWSEPLQPPPQANVPAPINVGSDPQTKSGDINALTMYAGTFYDRDNNEFYINPQGYSIVENITATVGISASNVTATTVSAAIYKDPTNPNFELNLSGTSKLGGPIGIAPTGNINPNITVLTVNSGGFLNTGTPTLEVVGAINVVYDTKNLGVYNRTDDTGTVATGIIKTCGTDQVLKNIIVSGGIVTRGNCAADNTGGADGGIGGSGTATQVAFFTSDMTIGSDGNLYWDNTNKRLGIGTAGPAHQLDVRISTGASGIGGINVINSSAPVGTAYGSISVAKGAATTNIAGYFDATGATNNYGIIVPNGKVGIGTIGPTEKLQVVGNIKLGGTEGDIKDVNAIIGYNDLFLKSNTAENAPVYISGSQLSFYSGGTEKWRIDSTGTLIIGSVPWARLISFPSDCPTGQYVYGLGGTLKCSVPAGGIGGSIMYLQGIKAEAIGMPVVAECPSDGWLQADYKIVGYDICDNPLKQRTCYRIDKECQVMYLKGETVDRFGIPSLPADCPSGEGWLQADYRSIYDYYRDEKLISLMLRTCYRCQ